ncbi:hypothetical protein [Aquabacter cavernae]|uniref:hypothetical protein n=1 Tax=Aquabacter cavernae TaxID=2496029 RepID=UPI000F8E0048|nr:hypothetical protein [Aquabacter cavernae]
MTAPDRPLSTTLSELADKLAPYVTSTATLEPAAVLMAVVLLLHCREMAKALERIAAEHEVNKQMAEDVHRLGPSGQVVDLSAFIGRRSSADVVPFPGGAA